jgi:hypothetical protein
MSGFNVRRSEIRTIKQGDPLFVITDGLVTATRAGFEISSSCPREYRAVIQECIQYGWLKPVACMTAEEQLMETLKL